MMVTVKTCSFMNISNLYLLILSGLFVAAGIHSLKAYEAYRRREDEKNVFLCYKLQAAASIVLSLQALAVLLFKLIDTPGIMVEIIIISAGISLSSIPVAIAWSRYRYHKKSRRKLRYPSYISQRLAYCIQRFLHGGVNEAAGVDDDQVCTIIGFGGVVTFGT